MSNIELLKEELESLDEVYVKADGFDNAVIGYVTNPLRLVYSVTKCIEKLITEDDMGLEEAIEFFYFNVSGAYMGKETPLWCEDTLLKRDR